MDGVSAILVEKNESGRRNIMEKKTFEIFEISANRRSLSHFRSKKKHVGFVKTTALAHYYYFHSTQRFSTK